LPTRRTPGDINGHHARRIHVGSGPTRLQPSAAQRSNSHCLARPLYTRSTLVVLDGTEPDPVVDEQTVKPIVVCVDDDRNNLNALGGVLRDRGTVLLAGTGVEALELVHANPDVAVVLADLRMPGLAGPELLARIAQIRPHCRRAVVTGFPESEDLI